MINTLKKVPNVVADFVKVMPYSMPLKIIIGFLFTALGGSSVLGLLSEFAVYNYALVNGFRAPVEGIPYLRATVMAVSLAMIIVALVVFLFAYLTLKQFTLFMPFIVKHIQKALSYFNPQLGEKISHTKLDSLVEKSNATMLAVAAGSSLLVVIAVLYTFEDIVPYIASILGSEYKLPIEIKNPLGFLTLYFGVFTIYLSLFRPKYTKEISLSVAGISVLIAVLIMFNANWYSRFLNITGFGGERSVTLYQNSQEDTISGKLLIQSNDYYIILQPNNEVIEFPVKQVKKITYQRSPIFETD